ncbi:MAG: sn-glycerol-3-phosphate ABC transporter ATP-binding protein UgpC [Longicatena sp.]
MAGIVLSNVSKVYDGNVKVIENLNLEIKDKEFMVLVGPSGCGKSTTLRMIAGLESISGGELTIGDKVMNNVAPKDRDIAMVFQTYALYPHMNVYKNMAFGLQQRKIDKEVIDQKVMEAAKILDLEPYLKRKPKALSGGQRQRVALGRAMVRDPEVFLLDEPLSNLDAKLRTEMRSQISKLHQRLQTTFVYVTHDQTEAMTMADRIVVMKDGVIQQIDTPQNLYAKPNNMFVASFIGSPQMNMFECTIEKEKDEYLVNFEGSRFIIPSGLITMSNFEQYVGKKVYLGVRPEDLHVEETIKETYPDSQFEIEVDLVEMLGAEMNLYFNKYNRTNILRTPARVKINTGDTLSVGIDKNKIHLFDMDSEKAILR